MGDQMSGDHMGLEPSVSQPFPRARQGPVAAAGFTPAARGPAANRAIEVATFRSEPHELANWKAISTVELPCS